MVGKFCPIHHISEINTDAMYTNSIVLHAVIPVQQANSSAEVCSTYCDGREGPDGLCTDWIWEDGCLSFPYPFHDLHCWAPSPTSSGTCTSYNRVKTFSLSVEGCRESTKRHSNKVQLLGKSGDDKNYTNTCT